MFAVRGQFAYRPAAQSNGLTALVGILEVPAGVYAPEHLLTLSGYGNANRFSGQPVSLEKPKDPWNEFRESQIDSILTKPIWRRSAMMDVVQLYLRKTSVPQPIGKDLFMFVGLHASDTRGDETPGFGSITAEAGSLSWRFEATDTPEGLSKWAGNHHGAALQFPLWGWDGEPKGFNCSMEPEFVAQCDRLRHLTLRKSGVDAPLMDHEEAERVALENTAAAHVTGQRSLSDRLFRLFLQERAQETGLDSLTLAGWRTADQIRADDAQAQRIIRNVLVS